MTDKKKVKAGKPAPLASRKLKDTELEKVSGAGTEQATNCLGTCETTDCGCARPVGGGGSHTKW